ncbi:MAG: hypothetical protein LBK61_10015 [Spirochaetaceae bacterium]|jgi:hypothetical protein|nr:hypothetical protein [Spirochaetaceae bacterium]
MEELLSTDNIHREILDDAARKAGKISKGAESAVASMSAEWDGKLQKAVAEVKERYDAEIAGQVAEGKARLAMDKARAKLAKITGELENAMAAFFRGLPQNERLALLEHALSLRLDNVRAAAGSLPDEGGGSASFSGVRVETCGITKTEAETLLTHLSLTAARIDGREAENHELPSIILSTDDIKITASLRDEADAVLREKRSEVAEALFG